MTTTMKGRDGALVVTIEPIAVGEVDESLTQLRWTDPRTSTARATTQAWRWQAGPEGSGLFAGECLVVVGFGQWLVIRHVRAGLPHEAGIADSFEIVSGYDGVAGWFASRGMRTIVMSHNDRARVQLDRALARVGFRPKYRARILPDLLCDLGSDTEMPTWHLPSCNYMDPEENDLLDEEPFAARYPVAARMRKLAVERAALYCATSTGDLVNTCPEADSMLRAEIDTLRPRAIAERTSPQSDRTGAPPQDGGRP